MQWLIDLMTEWAAAQGYLTTCYVDKASCSTNLTLLGDLTVDNAWHTLDLSSWLPEGARAINVSVKFSSATVGDFVRLRTPPDTGSPHRCIIRPVVANITHNIVFVLGVTSDRTIEYRISGVGWTELSFRYRGWFL